VEKTLWTTMGRDKGPDTTAGREGPTEKVSVRVQEGVLHVPPIPVTGIAAPTPMVDGLET